MSKVTFIFASIKSVLDALLARQGLLLCSSGHRAVFLGDGSKFREQAGPGNRWPVGVEMERSVISACFRFPHVSQRFLTGDVSQNKLHVGGPRFVDWRVTPCFSELRFVWRGCLIQRSECDDCAVIIHVGGADRDAPDCALRDSDELPPAECVEDPIHCSWRWRCGLVLPWLAVLFVIDVCPHKFG